MGSNRGQRNNVLPQRTLKTSIHCSGIGVHTGIKVNMTLHPADPGAGIVFRRSDLQNGGSIVEATWARAAETPMCTTLIGEGGAKVATVEHLMAALSGCGIDNCLVELNGPEVPAMDGSAAPFVFLIECAGTVEQAAPRRVLEIRKEIEVTGPDRAVSISPGRGLAVEFEIDFESPAVARQAWSTHVDEHSFKRDISRARTFGFMEEVDQLRAMGLAQGGSLDNAIVISDGNILNEDGLRYDDEFVRHKVLDLIGDLYLAGGPIVGRVRGVRAGHALTLRLLKTLFADEDAWRWRDMTEADLTMPMGSSVPPARAVAARA